MEQDDHQVGRCRNEAVAELANMKENKEFGGT
jgi:hypothetical protein